MPSPRAPTSGNWPWRPPSAGRILSTSAATATKANGGSSRPCANCLASTSGRLASIASGTAARPAAFRSRHGTSTSKARPISTSVISRRFSEEARTRSTAWPDTSSSSPGNSKRSTWRGLWRNPEHSPGTRAGYGDYAGMSVADRQSGSIKTVGGGQVDGELSGQVIIVTGAGRGIGRAVATELAGAGARLVLVARTAADLARVAEEIGEDRATVVVGDVTDEASAATAVARAREWGGRLDGVVNNAGVGWGGPTHE